MGDAAVPGDNAVRDRGRPRQSGSISFFSIRLTRLPSTGFDFLLEPHFLEPLLVRLDLQQSVEAAVVDAHSSEQRLRQLVRRLALQHERQVDRQRGRRTFN